MRDIIAAIAFLALIFISFAYLGYTSGSYEQLELILRKFFEGFKGYINDPVLFMILIFVNNSVKTLIAMLGGFFFGIVPVIFIASNGYILGVVIAARLPEWGWSGVSLAILPHGILEIPAVLVASAYGLILGYRFARALFFGEEFRPHLTTALGVYLRVVLPTLFVAAMVEAFITPHLVPRV